MFVTILGVITGIFSGPFKSIATWGMVIVTVGGLAFGYLKLKEHEATQAALDSFNKQQIELAQKQNQEYKTQIDTLSKQTLDLTNQVNQLNSDLDKDNDLIQDYIDTSKDTNLDDIFNSVLQKMKGRK